MRLVIVIGAIAGLMGAQSFEVAAVKRSGPQSMRNFEGGPGTRDPSQITCTRARMMDLLFRAFPVEGFQISGPSWMESDADIYDLHAKVPEGATKEQAMVMMQRLLAERFGLAFHHETRDFTAYELVIAKGGVKMKESPGGRLELSTHFEGNPPHARLTARNASIAMLIGAFRPYSEHPIGDKTGLSGQYDATLEYDPRPAAATHGEPDAAPMLSVAIEQQLGLKFVDKKLPFDVIVVDHIEKNPVDN